MSATTARYGGTCGECGDRFEPGTPIVRESTAHDWQHAACPPPADPLAPNNPVCTTCWLDHPKGACDR
ncbi:hypothetical protein [Aeromicrobium sp. Leaf291]|uniref:hypothetical protein n=1 Tax=Aeromicrobium sp. Leaf291 TaxID=1736325 RepID=UPI0006F8EB49|nr:hypothetical protein [Aeromicrobium sp. Leaf291]KQP81625.1 hypothetical protein ASF35_16470 [Aeromicrobium sp. Leaf291]